jgi:hypothetical protein
MPGGVRRTARPSPKIGVIPHFRRAGRTVRRRIMSDRLTLDTGTGEPVHVKLAEGQDRASLEEDLMEAARNGTVVTVKGSVKGTSSDTIHINPSNALWWAIDDAPKQSVGRIY